MAAELVGRFVAALDEQELITDVDYNDVMALVSHLAKTRDIREEKRANAHMSTLHCFGVEPERSGYMAMAIQSRIFQQAVAIVIVLNSVFIGFSLEVSIRHEGQPASTRTHTMYWIEIGFLCIYMVELAMKLYVHRLHFFVNHEWHWNNMDFVIVLLSFQDMLFHRSTETSGNSLNVTFIRLLRLSRVSRMFKVFRIMLFFRELRVLLRCVGGSLRSMLWSVVMLGLFYYIFAVIFLNGALAYVYSDDASNADKDDVLELFGTVFKTMRTLYIASTGGVDWHEYAEPLLKVGAVYYGIYLFFIAFAFVAVLNIVTGIFVSDAIQASKNDTQESILAQMEDERKYEDMLRTLFEEMDSNLDGVLSIDEFCEHLADGAHGAYLGTLGLEIGDAKEFHQLLCTYLSKDKLDEAGFVRACRRFRLPAKYSDVILLRAQASDIARQVARVQAAVEQVVQVQMGHALPAGEITFLHV